jgi:hypothetical protein
VLESILSARGPKVSKIRPRYCKQVLLTVRRREVFLDAAANADTFRWRRAVKSRPSSLPLPLPFVRDFCLCVASNVGARQSVAFGRCEAGRVRGF